MKNFNIKRGSLKNPIYKEGERITKNQYIGVNFLKKRGAWSVCRFKGRVRGKKGEVFLMGG